MKWRKAIINYFWHCCERWGGDGDKLIEMFHSCLMHVTNSHKWTTSSFKRLRGKKKYPLFNLVLACLHCKLTRKGLRRTPWLQKGSDAFKKLFKMLTEKTLCDDIKHCKDFRHTGHLENYHNVRLKYLPKRQHYSYHTTVINSMITAIEVNHNSPEPSAVNTSKKIVSYSKAAGQWVLKKACQKKDYTYRSTIMNTSQMSRTTTKLLLTCQATYVAPFHRTLPQEMSQNQN